MLVLDAEHRVTAAEALAHPYFESLRDTEDESKVQKYDDSFDDVDRTLEEWKRECGFHSGFGHYVPCVCKPLPLGCRSDNRSGGQGALWDNATQSGRLLARAEGSGKECPL